MMPSTDHRLERSRASGLYVPSERKIKRAAPFNGLFGPTLTGFKAPAGGAVPSPLDIATLLHWWDPNTSATSSLWSDMTGSGVDLEQTTSASEPTKLTADADLDGNDGFSFDGTNDFFVTSANITFGKFEIWIFKKSTTMARIWIRDDGAATIIGYGYSPGGPHGFVKDSSGNRSMVDATGYVANPSTVHLHRHRYDAHAGHVISNGSTDYSMSTVVDESPGTGSQSGLLWIGSYLGTSEFSTFKLGDVLIFSEPLTGSDLTDMLTWAADKYPSAP